MSIKIQNLEKTFSDNKQALKNVSINFQENKITGLIGFNGSGKTTTFNILVNFLEKYNGKIFFNKIEMNQKNKKEFYNIKKQISYLSGGTVIKNSTKVIKHLYSICFLYMINKKEAYKKILEIAKKIDFDQFLNKPIKALSKGNQQKIKIISSLLNPNLKYLFLDEPFDGLDPIMVEKVKRLFLDLKKVTIIITSHRMEVVQSMCEEFYVLKDGELIDSSKKYNKNISLIINKEVPISDIKKLSCVLSLKKEEDKTIILIDDIKNFKKVNEIAIKSPKFIYCSLENKNLAESVFEGYGV